MGHKFFKNLKTNKLTWLKDNFILVLIVCVILAMATSLLVGLGQSVWFDEAYSIALAKQPISQIINLTSVDTHPPLYYLLLSCWGNLFGWGEVVLRGLSVLAMGGAIFLAGMLVKKMFSVKSALMTLPFIAFMPLLIRYGFEIRMYAIASLIGVGATYLLVLAIDEKNKRRSLWLFGAYSLLVVLGVMTLYYTALLWIAHLVWILWRNYKNKESLLRAKWPLAYIASVVLFLPWLPTFVRQLSNGALAPISQSMTVDNLLGIVSFSFLYRPIWQLGPILSLIILFVIVAIIYVIIKAFKIVSKEQKSYLVLLAMYVIVPITALTLVGILRPMYIERYLAHIIIGGYMLVGVSVAIIADKKDKILRFISIGLIIAMLLGIMQLFQVGNYNFQRLQKPDLRQASTFINNCNSAKILAADPYVAIELGYYVSSCPIYFYSDTAKLSGGYAMLSNSSLRVEDPKEQLNNEENIYYVYYDNPKLDMPMNLSLKDSRVFGNLTVERYSSK